VSSFERVEAAAERVESELGPIEVWANDAMTTVFAPLWEVDPADFERAVEVTFLGQVWGTKVALRHMRARDRGANVNVGSALAFIGIPFQTAYCSSTFACRGFFESTRAELLHEESHVRMGMELLVAAGSALPGLGNPYAALEAWATQLTSQPVQASRPVNLYHPVDTIRQARPSR